MRLTPAAYRTGALMSGWRCWLWYLVRTGPPCSIAQVGNAARTATVIPACLWRGTFWKVCWDVGAQRQSKLHRISSTISRNDCPLQSTSVSEMLEVGIYMLTFTASFLPFLKILQVLAVRFVFRRFLIFGQFTPILVLCLLSLGFEPLPSFFRDVLPVLANNLRNLGEGEILALELLPRH